MKYFIFYYNKYIMGAEQCIIDGTKIIGGKNHPYRYCIKPLDQMIDYWKILFTSGSFNMVGITEHASAMINYATALVTSPKNALAWECGGKLGNMYLLKTNLKCKDGNTLYKYIDNIIDYNALTQRNDEDIGILPAAIGSAFNINGIGLFKALYEDTKPECTRIVAPCHVVTRDRHQDFYSGDSPAVHISTKDFESLRKNNPRIREVFTNLNSSKTNIKGSEEDEESEHPTLYGNDDLLMNLYHLLFGILILYFIYKLITKK